MSAEVARIVGARRWVGVAVGVIAVGMAAGVGAVLLDGDESRPAPPMTDEARAAGAVRLTYPDRNRGLPPPTVYFPFDGRSTVRVEFGDVEPGPDGLVASFGLGTVGDERWHHVELPAGGQTDVERVGVRVRVLAVYDGEWAKDDAADVVVEALP